MPTLTRSGETLTLHPAPAVVWNETVFVADVHLGKAATFRAHGMAVPGGTTNENLQRLSDLVADTGARRLVILGDLMHAASGMTDHVVEEVTAWLTERTELEVVLVRGNHDRRARDVIDALPLRAVDEPAGDGPFVWRHHPVPSDDGYVLAGHVHPAATLRFGPREQQRLPCFHATDAVLTLPSFGEFTGGAAVSPAPGDEVFVIADDEVIPF